MTFSRQEIVRTLRRAGLEDAAAAALSTLPEQMDDKTIERFCTAYGLTQESPAGQGHRRPLGRARPRCMPGPDIPAPNIPAR